jgi:hypothetical protein
LLAAIAALGGSASASAQSLDEARARWAEADFEGARREFRELLESISLDAPKALEAHRHLAVLYFVLGDEARARDHVEAAIALEPTTVPPEGSPAAAEALFRLARERLGEAGATLTIDSVEPLEAGERGTVRAGLSPAPSALASSVRLRCDGAEARAAPPTVSLDVRPVGTMRCTAEALSPRGAALITVERELLMAADQPRERRPLPWIIGASVAGAAIVAVVVGVTVAGDDSAEFGGTTVVGW